MKLNQWITFILALSVLSSTAWGQTFDNFQKILNKGLSEKSLENGGFESSFDYQKVFDEKALKTAFQEQKKTLKEFDIKSLKTKNQALAFWINSYNFFMINIIIEKGFKKNKLDIKSVKDFGSFFSPYKIFTKEINNIGGKNYSLDQIEKKTLLGEKYKKMGWKDARIHFAVNCASVGCPPLIKSVYKAKTLDQVLDSNIQKALKTKRHFSINKKELNLTHLFKWYKKDFKEHSGSVKSFLKKYTDDSNIKKSIDNAEDTEYIEYDWKLNRPKNF